MLLSPGGWRQGGRAEGRPNTDSAGRTRTIKKKENDYLLSSNNPDAIEEEYFMDSVFRGLAAGK